MSERAPSPEGGRDGTHIVSSAILKETAVTNERGLKKSACSRPPVDSYVFGLDAR